MNNNSNTRKNNNGRSNDLQNIDTVKSTDDFILYSVGLVLALFFIIVSLPTVLFALVLTIIFINIKKINKIYFCVTSLILAILVNFKFSFIENYLLSSINFFKLFFSTIIKGNSVNMPTIYKNYIFHVNLVWQLLIALIISSVIAEIHYIHTKEAKKGISKADKKREVEKESAITKYLEKIDLQKHDDTTTTIGADYENIKSVKINDNAKHIIVAGTTGAGKTVAIANFIESALQKNYPVLAIDGKGDLGEGSLLNYMQALSKKNNRKLYIINFVEPSFSDCYNPFKNAGMTEAKDMLIGMSDWSEPHYKVNTERYLQQLIKILNIKKIPLDLNTIIKYSPTLFQNLITEMKDKEEISIDEFTKLSDIIEITAPIVNSAMARFATTAESEAGEIFNCSGVDVYTALKEKANILIILDPLGKPELSKQVGRLAILDAKKAVSKLFSDKTRKYFIFDEFNVYASDVAIDLLNKSRSANVTCIPAFQSLSDLDKAGGVALRNQVIENCNNYIIMRQNSYDSSAEWEKVIGQEKTTNYSYSVENKASIFGNKIISTGNGNMHESLESKYTYTDIQNLAFGQSIFISKDQKIEKKLKMRFVKVDECVILTKKEPTKSILLDETVLMEPITESDFKKKEIKEIKTEPNMDVEIEDDTSYDDIENILK
ncbi:type IV secretory system conjugative DNA transfer family protein [Clostridium estertheticum]|uniref:TraD/TraG TraM recognition site domain-containing protein n=1 Tax=Clostridium estertheticum subsp. estertheticum TaxID=1552 RepID=A0A1J0GN73_9CLOT|nr:helicase HerA-like domain-containing protein [Clostridium estertheticum]APC42821.1 hypothetical protein A7L45_22030 [Clostridium estertheticum subsp. estertheticum]